jgi:hypothetical protein
MFFGDWLRRRVTLSPNRIAPTDAVNDNQPITSRDKISASQTGSRI